MTQRVFYLLTVPDGADPTLWVPPGTCTITPVRCETCKHFSPAEDSQESFYNIAGFGQCNLSESDGGVPNQYGTRVDPATVQAYAKDGEAYCAILRVRPTFGCVQWEAKE